MRADYSQDLVRISITPYNSPHTQALFTRRYGNPTARVTLARGLKDSSGLQGKFSGRVTQGSFNFPVHFVSKITHYAMFFFCAYIFNSSYLKSQLKKIWSSSDFVRSYKSTNVFVFSSFYCNMICFAPFRRLTVKSHRPRQRTIQNITAKSYPVFAISKIEIKSEECAQEISSCFICFSFVLHNR